MKQQAGLTLIEVLIASLILFMSLAVVSAIFRQNLDTQQRALMYLKHSEQFPNLLSQIRFRMESGERSGQIMLGDSSYTWQATQLKEATAVGVADPETMVLTSDGSKLVMWEIELLENERSIWRVQQAIWADEVALP